MANTKDFDLCQQYVINYMESLEKQVNECQLEFLKQSQTCPIQAIPLDQIDQYLKEVVDRERKYLLTRNNRQLEQFKNEIYRQDLLRQISTYHLTMDQVSLKFIQSKKISDLPFSSFGNFLVE